MSTSSSPDESMRELPDSPPAQAECDATYCTSIRLGWLWEGAPKIAGGTYEVYYSQRNDCSRISEGSFAGNIIELESVPISKPVKISVKINGFKTVYDIMVFNTHDILVLPKNTEESILWASLMLNNLGIATTAKNSGAFTQQRKWAFSWFQRNIMGKSGSEAKGELWSSGDSAELIDNGTLKEIWSAATDFKAPENFYIKKLDLAEVAHKNLFALSQYEVLYREWSQSDEVQSNDKTAMDHDPLSSENTPVFGGCAQNRMTLSTELFVISKNKKNECEATFFNTINLPQPINWLQSHLHEIGIKCPPRPAVAEKACSDGTNTPDKLNYAQKQDTPGYYGRYTEWGVRLFQYYAHKQYAACEVNLDNSELNPHSIKWDAPYIDRLAQKQLVQAAKYDANSPVSGALNKKTQEALCGWLMHNYRCPVVIFATKGQGKGRYIFENYDNLWRHTDCEDSSPRMFAVDFSKTESDYTGIVVNADKLNKLSTNMNVPFSRITSKQGWIVVGDWGSAFGFSGPRVGIQHSWEAETILNIPNLFNVSTEAATTAQISTFKVLRALSWVECNGQADSINSWDDCFMSLGVCHWTMGLRSTGGQVDSGELPAFVAYLQHEFPTVYDNIFGSIGLSPKNTWQEIQRDINRHTEKIDNNSVHPILESIRNNDQCFISVGDKSTSITIPTNNASPKYTSVIQFKREDGTFSRIPPLNTDGTTDSQKDYDTYAIDEFDFFKCWHVFYHFVMQARLNKEFIMAYCAMAKIRLRNLLNIKLTSLTYTNSSGNEVCPTLGKIFTSEKTIAMLLRWHVKSPSHIVKSKLVPLKRFNIDNNSVESTEYISLWTEGYHLEDLLNEEKVSSWGNPEDWTNKNEKEQQLINAILRKVPSTNSESTIYTTWQVESWGTELKRSRFATDKLADKYAGHIDNKFTSSFLKGERTLKCKAGSFEFDN